MTVEADLYCSHIIIGQSSHVYVRTTLEKFCRLKYNSLFLERYRKQFSVLDIALSTTA